VSCSARSGTWPAQRFRATLPDFSCFPPPSIAFLPALFRSDFPQ
jgi:hypothetical protein